MRRYIKQVYEKARDTVQFANFPATSPSKLYRPLTLQVRLPQDFPTQTDRRVRASRTIRPQGKERFYARLSKERPVHHGGQDRKAITHEENGPHELLLWVSKEVRLRNGVFHKRVRRTQQACIEAGGCDSQVVEGKVSVVLLLFTFYLAKRVRTTACAMGGLPVPCLRSQAHRIAGPSGVLSSRAIQRVSSLLRHVRARENIRSVITMIRRVSGSSYCRFTVALKGDLKINGQRGANLVVLLSARSHYCCVLANRNLRNALPSTVYQQVRGERVMPSLGVKS